MDLATGAWSLYLERRGECVREHTCVRACVRVYECGGKSSSRSWEVEEFLLSPPFESRMSNGPECTLSFFLSNNVRSWEISSWHLLVMC